MPKYCSEKVCGCYLSKPSKPPKPSRRAVTRMGKKIYNTPLSPDRVMCYNSHRWKRWVDCALAKPSLGQRDLSVNKKENNNEKTNDSTLGGDARNGR